MMLLRKATRQRGGELKGEMPRTGKCGRGATHLYENHWKCALRSLSQNGSLSRASPLGVGRQNSILLMTEACRH